MSIEGKNVPDTGFLKLVEDLKSAQETEKAALENVPFRLEIIPEGLMRELWNINQELKRKIKQYSSFENPSLVIENYLVSRADIFPFVFTTGEVEPSISDSIYFVSPYGISLRLKRADLAKGIDGTQPPDFTGLVQPMVERIIFLDTKNQRVSLKPEIGLDVEESTSKEFFDSMNSNTPPHSDYQSPIKIYEQNGQIIKVENPHQYIHHPGNIVNVIL